MDCSLPGSSVHGILQARMLELVAISFFLTQGLNPGLLYCLCLETLMIYRKVYRDFSYTTLSPSCTLLLTKFTLHSNSLSFYLMSFFCFRVPPKMSRDILLSCLLGLLLAGTVSQTFLVFENLDGLGKYGCQ